MRIVPAAILAAVFAASASYAQDKELVWKSEQPTAYVYLNTLAGTTYHCYATLRMRTYRNRRSLMYRAVDCPTEVGRYSSIGVPQGGSVIYIPAGMEATTVIVRGDRIILK